MSPDGVILVDRLDALERGARPPAVEPTLLIRACDVQVKLASGLRRIKIQMDSGAWLYADVPPSAILTPNGGPPA